MPPSVALRAHVRACLTVEEVADYVDPSASGERSELMHHVEVCEVCRRVVAATLRAMRTHNLRAGQPQSADLMDTAPVGDGRVALSGDDDFRDLATIDPQRYAVGNEIARGGMGRIMSARDRRLGRDVAIKELLVASGELRARFEREARITARLQHPAIVNLLEAGMWPGGEPFFVMKLVAGEPLSAAIAARPTLELRLALLPNVISAVDALAYAHSRRVIHRDLKPANVLVGEFGETVVIDWGLAKDLADKSGTPDVVVGPYRTAGEVPGDTVEGAILGTPAYMAVEQAEGAAVDERADVYSLGAMLYNVLAGAPPYTGKTIEHVLANVIAGALPPLETRVAGVPADLVTIVNKAMAHAAADRYPSAKELADDLKKFQTGQLVDAHRYSSWQLVRRWLRRHRTAVAVAAIAAILLGAVGVVSLVRIFREQARTDHQRLVAQQNRGEAEELIRFMLIDLRDKLTPIGRLELLDGPAKKAVAYYERRGADLTDDELQRYAIARINLGDVLLQQAHADTASSEYRAALAISQQLAARQPTNAIWQETLATSHDKIGTVLYEQGDMVGALAELRAALAVSEKAAVNDPASSDLQRHVSVRHREIGDVLFDQGDAAALDEYRVTLATATVLAKTQPANPLWQSDLAAAHQRIGDVLSARGDSAGALESYRAALAIAETLAANHPKDALWHTDVPGGHGRVGDVLRSQGDLAGALAQYRAAIQSGEALVALDPSNARWQADLSVTHDRVGDVLLAQGDQAAALVEYRTYLSSAEALATKDPTSADHQRDLVIAHTKLGDVSHDKRAALAEYRAGLKITEALAAKDPTNTDSQRLLVVGHSNVGLALSALGDVAGALEEQRASLSTAAALVAKDPTNAGWHGDLADAHLNLGDALFARNDKKAARDEYEAGLAIAKGLEAKEPSNVERIAKLVAKLERIK